MLFCKIGSYEKKIFYIKLIFRYLYNIKNNYRNFSEIVCRRNNYPYICPILTYNYISEKAS